MTEIKVALIGYGGMGKQHVKRIQNNKKLIITGVYDIDPTIDYSDLDNQVLIYSNWEEVLRDTRIDAIIIATPNDSHFNLASEAMYAGKHVLCEKPVTLNHKEFQDLDNISKQTNKLIMVNQNRRWDENYLIVKKLLDEKKLGELYYLESRVQGSRGIPNDWRRDKSQGGGMLLDWGVHLIDRVLLLFKDQKVDSIKADLNYFLGHNVDDGFKITITFTSNKTAFIEVGTYNFVELPEWYVVGSTGTAVVEDYELNGQYVTLTEELSKTVVPVETGAGLTKTMAPRNDNSILVNELPNVSSNINEFYDNFADVINNEASPIVKNEEVLRVMKLIDAAFQSHENNEVIKFNDGL